ncbi:MAG: hypothetical protein ACK4GN_07455 [Runella sp.]
MSKTLLYILLISCWHNGFGQFIENFDICERADLEADCWLFNACNVTPVPSRGNGCFLISSPMPTDTATATTPALALTPGQLLVLNFNHQLTKPADKPRKIIVYLWDIEKRVRFSPLRTPLNLTYNDRGMSLTTTSFNIPTNSSGKHRLIFAMISEGGEAQILIDNISIISNGLRRLDEPGSCKGQPPTATTINDLTSKPDQCRIRLTWTIPNNNLATSFTIQRSSDGLEFKDIGRVAVSGSGPAQPYSYIDTEPLLKNYYRIRQTDLSGRVIFSNVVQISDPCEGTQVVISQPNNNVFLLRAKSSDPSVKEIGVAQLINVQGIILKSRSLIAGVPVTFDGSGLPVGTYIIRVQNNRNHLLLSQKITIY